MNWKTVWITLFHTTKWLGIDIGFWVSMGIALFIAILMNLVFWSLKPINEKSKKKKKKDVIHFFETSEEDDDEENEDEDDDDDDD